MLRRMKEGYLRGSLFATLCWAYLTDGEVLRAAARSATWAFEYLVVATVAVPASLVCYLATGPLCALWYATDSGSEWTFDFDDEEDEDA